MSSYQSLYKQIGYEFRATALLELALTHRSLNGKDNNERLEFLGDSILNFLIGAELYQRFPDVKEGKLSRLRSSLVKGQTLAELGREFELNLYMRLGPGELKTGGARRDSTLEDSVEAIIGAIYLDADFDTCKQVVLGWFETRLNRISLENSVKDNKTRLQEALQGRKLTLPEYNILTVQGQSHKQTFTVECLIATSEQAFTGTGHSRRHAEQQAAGKALAELLKS